MTRKIFKAVMAAACGVLIASLLIIMGCLYDYFGAVQTSQLLAELDMAAAGVETAGLDYLQTLGDFSNRLTWIGADGDVLYDAKADEAAMENHAEREEVREALTSGAGQSVRYSNTLLEKTMYCAKRLPDGTVLRISESRATIAVLILGMLQPICLVLLAALVAAYFLARRLSEKITQPLNALDLDHPTENQAYDELAPLLRRISQQRKQINAQLRQLQQRKDEFTQITACMNEGLVLLAPSGTILSINPAAKRFFNASELAVGQDYLTVERCRELTEGISEATEKGHSEITLNRDGRVYQLDMSRIQSDGETVGVVLLIFDITDKAESERNRREFTANVSHELKTPLTAILGSSELLQNGMVKSEDVPRFVGHIHDEAARLLALIEDIIRLSQLDEGASTAAETVDVAQVASEVVALLAAKAEECGVTLALNAEACFVTGERRLVHEIVYNLTENAIKYNVPGGRVAVDVKGGVLTVADTGIGIPKEDQARVFERFYRVDKSHSKAIGGTGLGLSIVKHAAAYLNAEITLESEEGKGTTVRVEFES